MSILSVDQIQPIGSGTTITLNATEVKTGTEITVGTGASIFSPAGNTLTFGTNNVERIRIKNDGKVGINTSNNSNAKLEISDRSTGTFSGLAVGTQYGTSLFGGYNNYPAIMNSNQQPLIYCDTNNDRTELFGDTVGFGTTCAFRVNNAERLRIDSDGRILVGHASARIVSTTVNPYLQLEGTTFHQSALSVTRNTNDEYGSYLILGKSRAASNGGNVILQDNDIISEVRFAGSDGNDMVNIAAQIRVEVDGTPQTDQMPGAMILSTNPGSTSTTERLRITSAGYREIRNYHYGPFAFTNDTWKSTITVGDPGDGKHTTIKFILTLEDVSYRQGYWQGEFVIWSSNANGGPGVSHIYKKIWDNEGSTNWSGGSVSYQMSGGAFQFKADNGHDDANGNAYIHILDVIGDIDGTTVATITS